jgi:putative ABC transport system permease protein
MSLGSRLRSLLGVTLGRARAERDLHDEITSYLELLIAEKRSAGLSPIEARRAALIELRGADQVKEAVRDVRPGVMVETLIRDVRHAVRGLRRQPGITVTALVTLAVAIGGATGVFSVVDAVLLRPLSGVRDPARLVTFSRIQPSGSYDNFSLPDFHDYAAGAPAFQSLAAHVGTRLNADVGGGVAAVRLRADLVTGGYFSTLGVTPLLGRLLDVRDEAAPSGGRVVVLSEGLWRSGFGGAADIVGRTIRLNGWPFRIVGVVGGRFTGTATGAPMDLWLPLAARPVAMPRLSDGIEQDRAAGWMQIFGRLRPHATLAEARAQLSVTSSRLARAYPLTDVDRHVDLAAGLGLYPDDRAELAGTMRLLLGAVVLVLVIGCANVAGLLLVRFSARRREMAARLALGGGVRRLVMQTLVEGLALTLPAAVLGLGLAGMLARLATAAQPPSSVFHDLHVTLDLRVLGFALGSAILTGLLVAALPALHAARLSPMSVLQQGGRGGGGGRGRRGGGGGGG